MKIAVQLFGHLRTYKQCYQSLFQNLLNHYDCDVFIHTWETMDHNTQTWHTYRACETGQSAEKLRREITQIYQPKAVEIEKQIVKDEGVIVANDKEISLFGMKCMMHSMERANKLREEYQQANNVHYDYVLCVRPDIMLLNPINFEDLADDDDGKCLYTAGFYKKKKRLNDFKYIGASDVLFFAKPDVISSVLNDPDAIINQIKNPETTQYGPEYSIMYAIEKKKIRPVLLNYLLFESFNIVRGTDTAKQDQEKQRTSNKFHDFARKIIRLHFNHWNFEFVLLPCLPFNIFNFSINATKHFVISLGKVD